MVAAPSIAPAAAVARVKPGHQRTSGGQTERTARVEASEAQAFHRHLIQGWCLNDLLPITTQVTIAQVVGHDKDYVGFLSVGERGNEQEEYRK